MNEILRCKHYESYRAVISYGAVNFSLRGSRCQFSPKLKGTINRVSKKYITYHLATDFLLFLSDNWMDPVHCFLRCEVHQVVGLLSNYYCWCPKIKIMYIQRDTVMLKQ